MAIMDLQVSPRKAGSVSVSEAVAEAHRLIQNSGLKHVLHPMGTCIEGSAGELYALAANIHARLAEIGYDRIGMFIKVDERLDRRQSMEEKVGKVMSLLGSGSG